MIHLKWIVPFVLAYFISNQTWGQDFRVLKQIEGNEAVLVKKIRVAADGSLYAVGSYYGSISVNGVKKTSNGSSDCFVIKYTSSLDFVWLKTFGGVGKDEANDFAINKANQLLVVGGFKDKVDFDPSGMENYINSSGQLDSYISTFDQAGNFLSVATFGGEGNDVINAILCDEQNNISVAGQYSRSVDFDLSGSEFVLSALASNGFVACYDDQMKLTGATPIIGGENGSYSCIESLSFTKSGRIMATGFYTGEIYFDVKTSNRKKTSVGKTDVFVVQYIPRIPVGVWFKTGGGTQNDFGLAVCTDEADNIYLGGMVYGKADFNLASADSGEVKSRGESADAFIAKYTTNGHLVWAKSFGGIQSVDAVRAIEVVDSTLYAAGEFYNQADLAPDPDETTNIQGKGEHDGFMIELDGNGDLLNWEAVGGTEDDGLTTFAFSLDRKKLYKAGSFGKGDLSIYSQSENTQLKSAGTNNGFVSLHSKCKLPPKAKILAKSTLACGIQDTLVLAANSKLDENGGHWVWYETGCQLGPIGQDDSISITIDSNSTIWLGQENGCFQVNNCAKIELTYSEVPTPTIVRQGDELVLDSYDEITWYKDGAVIAKNKTSLILKETGNYYATAGDENGCFGTSSTLNVVSLKTSKPEREIYVYPNPTQGYLTIPSEHQEIRSSILTSPSGLEVKRFGSQSHLDLSGLAKGMYQLRVETQNSVYFQKVLLN